MTGEDRPITMTVLDRLWGKKVYVDLGDSIITGGELTGVLKKDNGSSVRCWVGNVSVQIAQIVYIEEL